MTRAVLSLGSNLGDRLAHLQEAVRGFGAAVVAASPVYETAAWGGVEQPDFLNAVLIVAQPGVDEWGWLARARQDPVALRAEERRIAKLALVLSLGPLLAAAVGPTL